jgi:hypothetical protein
MAKNIKYYGGERIFSLQKEKILEISKIFSNPFWKDVFYSLYLAKPLVKLNIKECLSLDLLNFVSIDDFPFYMRWENIKPLIKSNNFIRYYTKIISNISTDIKKCLKDNIDNINTENVIRYVSLQHFLRIRKYIDQSAMSIPSISFHFKNF